MDIKSANIQTRKLSELINWEQNPRSIEGEDFQRLQDQIKRLGIYKPLLVNQDNIVLGGNMRKRALVALGVEEVLCSIIETKNEADMLEYALSDNDQVGRYEEQELAELLSKYEINLDLYRVDLGTPSNLNDVLSKYEPIDDDEEEDLPEGDGEPAVSKLGEVYDLGDHRLMCGDSTSMDDVLTLMAGEKAQLVFTDPPYMVDYQSDSGTGVDQNKGKIANDNLSDEDAGKFFRDVATNLAAVTKDSASLYWWLAMKNVIMNRQALEDTGWYVAQTLIWVKESMVFSMGQDFHRCYEPCLFGYKKGKVHFKNKRIANYKDVVSLKHDQFADHLDIWFAKRDQQKDYVHPTQKPTALVKRALKKHTRRDDVVVDLFGGSGSTLIGCQDLKRRAYLMELDPQYCDVIRKRYASYIGRDDEWQKATPVVKL